MAAPLKILVFLIASYLFLAEGQECNKRKFNYDSFVCVCNAGFCDFLDPLPKPNPGKFTRIQSSKDGARFKVHHGDISSVNTGEMPIGVDYNSRHQEMLGFGGAFTDSAGINLVKLSLATQWNLMRSYFAKEGIRYSVCRIPIAGTDFSTRVYSYDDHNEDVGLAQFALAKEDYDYKLPFIRWAREINPDVLFFATPWAPPAWMKTNGQANGKGGLRREMWDPYANYLVKFVQAYEEYGIPLWGMTPQNEPLTGFWDYPFNTCAWSAEDMRDWIKTSLGPALERAGLRRLKLMVLDHNRESLPSYPATIFRDPEASKYVDGTAVHWYTDWTHHANVLTQTHDMFPDKFILYTESVSSGPKPNQVQLGYWGPAESYANNIIDDMNNWVVGWLDWNIALSQQGGPSWVNNFVDSPMIINGDNDEFYKQPTFYALGHFSKFIDRGAVRMATSVKNGDTSFKAAAVRNKDGSNAVILLNMHDNGLNIGLDAPGGQYINFYMEPKSIETVLFN